MRVVDETELKRIAGEAEALEAVERAFEALARGEVTQPPPMAFDFPGVAGEVHVKGAALRGAPIFALKVASGFYENAKKGLPTSSGLVLVFDAETGFPLSLLLDNAYLTEMRTAAAGALAARLLARPAVDKMAVIGTGAQARYQLRAISRVVAIGRVEAFSPRAESRDAYAREMREMLGLNVLARASAAEAVSDAEIVVSVTPSRSPVVSAKLLRADATVIAVGSDGPDKQELEVEVLARADKIVADDLSQCVTLGEIHHAVAAGVIAEEQIHAELGDILIGAKPGREGDELIVCDLTGVGAQDAAIAAIVCDRLGLR